MTVTFMPKPIFGDNGTGMHTHQSIWKGETPLFAGYGLRRDVGDWRCTTSPASCITRRRSRRSPIRAPTRTAAWCRASRRRSTWRTRSRNRSAVGAHPDVFAVAQGQAHRSALPRPDLQSVPRVLRDADGGARRHPAPARSGPAARQGHLRADAGRAGRGAEHAARRSRTSLDNLKRDHEFLLKGDVFTEDLIETWIDYKMAKEVSPIRLRPHPYEFALYYDA